VPADLTIRYPATAVRSRIVVRRGALKDLGRLARRVTQGRRVAVVSDANVAALHGPATLRALHSQGFAAELVTVPAGERTKRPRELVRLWDQLAGLALGRDDLVVALGGGVIGDLAGFAAATWLRGVSWIGVPTSLLAQVDSSVGGKTAVDLRHGKNLVGAFHQPPLVVVDPDVLATLPVRHRRAGLAEVVKVAMATDARLFVWLERNLDRIAGAEPKALEQAVVRAVRAKARVVQADERERTNGPRTALNLGHTLGHALEAARGYRGVLHGEAVAIGLRAATRLSVQRAHLPKDAARRLEDLLDRLGLPRRMPATAYSSLVQAMAHDKKRSGTSVRWVLTPRVGHASVPHPIDSRLVKAVLLSLGARA
jgi:3-dehydroquinate synthase